MSRKFRLCQDSTSYVKLGQVSSIYGMLVQVRTNYARLCHFMTD